MLRKNAWGVKYPKKSRTSSFEKNQGGEAFIRGGVDLMN